jgi:hypothetical protein
MLTTNLGFALTTIGAALGALTILGVASRPSGKCSPYMEELLAFSTSP